MEVFYFIFNEHFYNCRSNIISINYFLNLNVFIIITNDGNCIILPKSLSKLK